LRQLEFALPTMPCMKGGTHMDAVYVVLGVVFTLGIWGLALGCSRLGGPKP